MIRDVHPIRILILGDVVENSAERQLARKQQVLPLSFLGAQKNWLIHKYPENHRIDTLTKNDIWKRAAGIAKIILFYFTFYCFIATSVRS
jgi:hypothetical protein